MERKIFLTVLLLSLTALIVALLLPGGQRPDREPLLPWDIQIDQNGRSTVFGVTLGVTPYGKLRELLRADGKLSLFVSPDGRYATEGYFKDIYLSGIKADLVAVLSQTQRQMAAIYERGLRISTLESGNRKIRLAEQDERQLQSAPIEQLTFIPATDLEAELIASRFGEPQRRIREASGIEHWLYPEKGLDIAVNPDGKEVMQYLDPARFDQAVAPLLGR